jgi:ParB-like chromosome segregation protein Spo0J
MVPKMSTEAFEELKADIDKRGLIEPIWVKGDEIIDGRHRYRACLETGQKITTRDYPGDDIEAFVIAANVCRRQLSRQQRAGFAKRMLQLHPEKSNRAIAVEVGVHHKTVAELRKKEARGEFRHVPEKEAVGETAKPLRSVGRDGKRYPAAPPKPEHRAPQHPARVLVNRQDLEGKRFLRWLYDLHPSELTDAAHFVAELETQMRRLSSLMPGAATA